jgi:hypothetical protein
MARVIPKSRVRAPRRGPRVKSLRRSRMAEALREFSLRMESAIDRVREQLAATQQRGKR